MEKNSDFSSQLNHFGKSKREFYNWETKNKPGEFKLIPKEELHVDNFYQRDSNNNKANSLAREWNWVACGCICVSRRNDGTYFVIDGQHRVLAAKKRDDVFVLPCLVFYLSTIADEAQGFLDTNTHNKVPRMIEKFKAMLVAGDPTAIKLSEIAERHGMIISGESQPGNIGCIRLLMRWLQTAQGEKCVANVFPIAKHICEGRIFNNRIVEGLLLIESKLLPENSISKPLYRDRLLKSGYDGLIKSINASLAFYTNGGAKCFAIGIQEAMNKGCQKRLDLFS